MVYISIRNKFREMTPVLKLFNGSSSYQQINYSVKPFLVLCTSLVSFYFQLMGHTVRKYCHCDVLCELDVGIWNVYARLKGNWSPGIKRRSTPSLSIMAKRMTPPLLPSRAIA